MAPSFGIGARDHDLVSFTGADVVVTLGAAVVLDGFVGLHVAHVDGARGLLGFPGVGCPIMVGHR